MPAREDYWTGAKRRQSSAGLRDQAAAVRHDDKLLARAKAFEKEITLRLFHARLLHDRGYAVERVIEELQALLKSQAPWMSELRPDQRLQLSIQGPRLDAQAFLAQLIFRMCRANKYQHQSLLITQARILQDCDMPASAARLYWAGGKTSPAKEVLRPLLRSDVARIGRSATPEGLVRLVRHLVAVDTDESALAA